MLILILMVTLLAAGCEDEPSAPSSARIVCSNNVAPILIASKLDDDDGDGNPLDENYPTINDEDDDIADHAWIRDRFGTYHLFFHNEGHGAPSAIEHYTSHDLRNLEYIGVALEAPAAGWDAGGLWAPYVIRNGDLYYMFYTGLATADDATKQRIGVATSDDLTRWSRLSVNHCTGTSGDGCVYECRECWTTWGMPGDPFNDQCRDPFVIWDSENKRWLLFATTRSVNQYGVVTVAASPNLFDWMGAGYIDATRRLPAGAGGQSMGGEAENPFVVSHAGDYYLLFTDWRDPEDSLDVATPRTIAQYATATSLAVDTLGSAGWTYRGYTPDPGVNAIEVFQIADACIMSQSLAYPSSGYVPPDNRRLRLKCIDWTERWTFATSNFRFESTQAVTRVSSPLE